MSKQKTTEAKVHSHLSKDIKRIKKAAEFQMKMNILRKHQIKLLSDFLKKLLKEKRIDIEELKPFMPRKKSAEKKLFNLR